MIMWISQALFSLSHIDRHVGSKQKSRFAINGKRSYLAEQGQVIMVKTNGSRRIGMAI